MTFSRVLLVLFLAGPLGAQVFDSHNAYKIRSKNVCTTAPTVNQLLQFDGTNWCPATGGAGTMAIDVAGSTVGTRGTLNFATGMACTDNSGASRVDCSPDTAGFFNPLYVQLSPGASQTIVPNAVGAKTAINSTATTEGVGFVGTAVPSAIAAGGVGVSLNGNPYTFDGTNVDVTVSVAGSGRTLPSVPSAGFAKFSGSAAPAGFELTSATIATTDLPAFARPFSLQVAGCNNATASSSLDLPTTNAPTPTCHGTTYTWGTLDFDHASAKKASFSFRLPTGWTGNVDVGLDWFTAATTNTNKWTIESACLVEGTTDATAPSFNAAQTITTTSNGTTNILTRSAQAAITTTGCSAGNIMILRVGRDVTDTNTSADSLQNIDVVLRVTPQA